MKIYFIGQKGIPAKSGGVEKHVEELSRRLVKAGHDVFVYTRPNYTNARLKKYQGVNLISLPSVSTKHLDAISHTFRACLDVIKKDVDIIHFHSIGPSSLIWLVKVLKPSVPVISTFHTRCYQHKKWGIFARAYLRFGELCVCLLADKTITVSESLKNYAQEKYGVNTEYIPNGVTLPKVIRAEKIKKWGLKKDNYLVAVSRLVRHKGLHYLIKAYQKVRTNKKLVIVGGGAYTEEYVKELKEMVGGDRNIIFTGPQNGRALAELFSNAYLFVQPSESEGLSIALLEAMSFKLGALVSDINENKEAISKAGFTFKDKDVNNLKEKLAYLLKRPILVKKTGQMARARVKELYNWNNITKSTVKLYRKTVLERMEEKRKILKLRTIKRFISCLF